VHNDLDLHVIGFSHGRILIVACILEAFRQNVNDFNETFLANVLKLPKISARFG
jgi:hypothetical protein